jgi:Flp pilus assembly protein TadG
MRLHVRWALPRSCSRPLRSLECGGPPLRGQVLAEFAFVVSTFLVLVFGIIEFSWAIYCYNTIQHAANEAVRRAMVLNRPAGNYNLSDNVYGNAQPLPSCNPATILGTVACSALLLPPAALNVDVEVPIVQTNCPSPQPVNGPACFLATENVPAANRVAVTVRFAYRPIILFPMNRSFDMTGFATGQTQ